MKHFTLLLSFCLAVLILSAQNKCAFDEWRTHQIENGVSFSQIENTLAQQAEFILSRNSSRASNDTIYTIPVVVHVIHNGGAENISDSQIVSQIKVLNEDFRKMLGTNGDGNGVDTKIQFCLAHKTPDGKCCNGIVRVKSTLTNHQNYQRADLAMLSSWDATRYLNIYIVKTMQGGTLGYSSYPGSPANQDGAVIRHSAFGTLGTVTGSNNLGRTASHELGHWFGLNHTFQDSCGTDVCADGDHVCDTPPVAEPNFGCPASVNSCHNDVPDLNDLTDDYMDYTDDVCKSEFTAGQAARMQATMQTIRTNIWSQTNLISTGCDSNYVVPVSCPPVADFVALTQNICTGSSIYFMSRSLNNDTAWTWYFDGADTYTSNLQNPTITYSTPGTYGVKLVVKSANGTDSVERFSYITVSNPQAGLPMAWGENFENGNFPTNGLTIDNPDNGITWERTTDASVEGIASARIQNYINTNYGQADALVLPRLDFTALTSPIKMRFKWAYARGDANYSDEMIVLVSNDCGSNWTQKLYKTGNALATGPTQTTLFIPDSSQWKTALIDLSSYSTSNHVEIKIVNVTDGGNALYVDSLMVGNFDFSTLPSAVNENVAESNLLVYPNPATNSFLITNLPAVCGIYLCDAAGRQIFSEQLNRANKTYSVNTSGLSEGVYVLVVRSEEKSITKKIIIQNP